MNPDFPLSTPSPWASPCVAAGSFETYIRATHRIALLSPDEEVRLARRLRSDGDIQCAHRLISSHLRMVVAIARNYRGYGLPQADLVQEGNIGLMKAVNRFDPERRVRLVSYAIHWIKAEMQQFIIRNWRLVKIATSKAQRKLFFNLRSMTPGLEALKQTQAKTIAAKLSVTTGDVAEMERRFYGQDIALDQNVDDGDGLRTPLSYLADAAEQPLDRLEAEQSAGLQAKALASALDSLDTRSRRIVEARWLDKRHAATLHELGAELNVSAERVRQIQDRALQKMRALLVHA